MKLQNVQFFRIYRNFCVIIGFNNCKKNDLIWISIENSIMLTEHRAGPYLKAISSTFGSRVVFKHMLDWVKWLGPLRKNGAYYEEKEASKTEYEENTSLKIFLSVTNDTKWHLRPLIRVCLRAFIRWEAFFGKLHSHSKCMDLISGLTV